VAGYPLIVSKLELNCGYNIAQEFAQIVHLNKVHLESLLINRPLLENTMTDRTATVTRNTLESQITVTDTHIDDHHTVEDIGITLGMAIAEAIGDKKGLTRYGHAYVPLDEAMSRVVLDFSGRPGLIMKADFVRSHVGTFDVDLTREFFQGFVNHALVSMHIDNLRGANAHHQVETIFKAFGRALRIAASADPRMAGVMPSTKGTL
jgi:imidazoleglycerol-phosphate dehydratase